MHWLGAVPWGLQDDAPEPESLVGIAAGPAIGTLVVLAGSDGSQTAGSITVFALWGLLAYVTDWVVFVPSNLAKSNGTDGSPAVVLEGPSG